jgi:hypothetical protein
MVDWLRDKTFLPLTQQFPGKMDEILAWFTKTVQTIHKFHKFTVRIFQEFSNFLAATNIPKSRTSSPRL